MKKFIVLVIIFTSLLMIAPVRVDALSVSDYIVIGKKSKKTSAVTSTSEVKDIMGNGDSDAYQSCDGSDSILGDPKDEDSVAWLLDQILTYSTIVGMLLVIVLSSVDFLTVIVKSDDESMAKAAKKFGYRLIFAALLFFVPTITNAILDIFGLTSQSTCGLQQ